MGAGIDQELVREYYRRMTDREVLQVLAQDLKGLTVEAKEIIREEIVRRNLDKELSKLLDFAEEEEPEFKVYDENACPVEEHVRLWLEKSFQLLVKIFGETETRRRKVLLPERVDFPVKYDGSEESAFLTLDIVAKQMEVSSENITLTFYDDQLQNITEGTPGGMYFGKGEDEKYEISVVKNMLDDPERMVAILAHEIAHIKLLGEERLEENDEFLTDLTTIFFGLGIFNANLAFRTFADMKYYGWSTTGYLTQMEWGYALALFIYFRQEDDPAWLDHLTMNVKADVLQGLNFITLNEHLIFQG